MLAVCLTLTLFWDSSLLRPVKLLVVLVHEMWHGLMSLVAGVRLDGIEVHWNESGTTLVSGDFGKLGFIGAVSAGYIGCSLTGAILLRMGLLGRMERLTLVLFSVILIYFSWLFTSPLETAFYTGTGYGLAFLLVAALGQRPARGTLTALGTFFLFYSLFDLFDFTRDVSSTDAAILASYLGSHSLQDGEIGSTSVAISVVWTILILAASYAVLSGAVREALHYVAPAAETPDDIPVPQMGPEDSPGPIPSHPLDSAGQEFQADLMDQSGPDDLNIEEYGCLPSRPAIPVRDG